MKVLYTPGKGKCQPNGKGVRRKVAISQRSMDSCPEWGLATEHCGPEGPKAVPAFIG